MEKTLKFKFFNFRLKEWHCSDELNKFPYLSTFFIFYYAHLRNDRSEIIEFTGSKDRNGIDLYRNDLVKLYHKGQWCVCQIVFHKSAFRLKWHDGYINGIPINSDKYEKIGNIIDTPELFK